ncbi:MAG: prolyl oligopeptidase family serine peptidase [Flavobacteriaceae bacterium]|jgi:dipeptidyl aminopeptidase/acylaminoacyl peptidase|nr:prolyl oligopeptidase family serine peptidase [Flavobacteriaceae bacterium]
MNIKSNLVYCIPLIFFSVFISIAQTSADSLKYSELSNYKLSLDGKIAIVYKHYKTNSKADSIFVFNNEKLLLSKQIDGTFEIFKNNIIIDYNISRKEFEIIDPTTLKTQIITGVEKPIIINQYNLIFFLDTNSQTYRLVKISKNQIKDCWSALKENINFTNISENKERLFIQFKNKEVGIELIDLSNLKKTNNKEITYLVKQVQWSKKHPVLFLLPTTIGDTKYPYVAFYNYKSNKIIHQTLNSDIHYGDLEAISDNSFKILQSYVSSRLPYDVKNVELWSTNDRYLRNKLSNSQANIQDKKTIGHVIFNYASQKIYQPEKLNNYESIGLTDNTLLVFDSNQYLDYSYQWSSRPRDISIYDINSRKLTTIVKQQESPFNTTSLSPKGNYFIYFKEGILHVYNIKKREIENTFQLKNNDTSTINQLRIWSGDQKYFYFSTDNNLLQYDTTDRTFKTIINGNDIDSYYEILNSSNRSFFNSNSELNSQFILNDNNKLLIKKRNFKDNIQSLLVIDKEKSNIIIANTLDHISDIKFSADLRTVTYSLENFNAPKEVYIYQNGKTNLLLKSNVAKELLSWRKQIIVSYNDKFGNNLKGILFYPKDFNSLEKYPMITRIYEIQSHLRNRFIYPTYLNSDGFNIALLQENNYFVFLPDILDTEQGTGLSALHCVEESIKTALKQEPAIDKDKLGLFGFSHGGYKTNFIVTQTNIFKAAISGSGNSDIIRSYFSYNENFISPFFFQFENGQYKMPKTFKEDKELYLLNSPILFADQIKTPLLTFTGKKDENIHWEQQREFFIAMLRYNKPHIALFYKDEGHGLLKKENQMDITKRLTQWFDYFLKGTNTIDNQWVKNYTTFDNERIINK